MFRQLSPVQWLVDAVLAFGFFGVTGFVFYTPSSGDQVWGVLVSLGMAVALGLRRFSPFLALAVAWVSALAQMALGLQPMLSNVAIFVVLYATAAYGTRLLFWIGFSSAVAGSAAIAVYLVFVNSYVVSSGLDWRNLPLAVFVMLAALFALGLSWTAGALVRTAARARETRQARDAARAQVAIESERMRIARDMHDIVAHSLAVVIAQADGARYAAAADPAAATTALGTISSTARSALTDVRLLLTQLRHQQGAGPQPTLADLDGLFAQVHAAGVDLRVQIAPMPPQDVPAAVQLAVFRILQEALTNALRHGDGPVEVWLAWQSDHVRATVRNALRSPAREQQRMLEDAGGHGVVGMRERAQLVGGTLFAGATDGGFLVDAHLPSGAVA